MVPENALLAASALHVGFQAVVTLVVYPALADVPATLWSTAHAAHSRRITAVVAPVYVAVGAACLWALVSLPSTVPLLLAVGGHVLAGVVTAAVAAPTHSRLGRQGVTPVVMRRLVRADRVRLLGALLALGAAPFV